MPKDIKIIVADDHAFLRQGLTDHLVSHGHNVIGQAQDGTEALQLITDEQPDLAILDIEMPYLTGFSIAEICKKQNTQTKFIILSFHKETDFIEHAKRLGISGYLLKEDASGEILTCIETVMAGGVYFSKALGAGDSNGTSFELDKLSPSEKKILKLVADKKSSDQIAEMLFISIRTVEKHRSNIVHKLELSGASNSLTNWAIENKLLIGSL